MRGIDHVGQGLLEHMKVEGVAITLQEENVVGVDGSNGLVEPPVERFNLRFARIGRFIDRVIASHPGVIFVAGSDCLPQMHDSILEVLVLPEKRLVGRIIAMPILVLVTWQSMQVDNGVDLLLGAQVDDSIQALKALFLDDKGFHIGLEVPVVDREPKQVQAERGNILRIVSSEEIFQETIKEVYIRFLSKHIADGLSLYLLISGIARDEILHIHPASEIKAAQNDWLTLGIDDGSSLNLQNIRD